MSLVHGGYPTNLQEVHLTTEFDAYPLIPETVANEIIDGIAAGSAVLTHFQRLPNMTSRTHRMPVLATLGNADFTGDTTDDNLVAGANQQIDDARMLAIKGSPYGTADPGYVPEEGIPGLKKTHQMKWENVFIVAEPIAILLPVPDDVLSDSAYDIWGAMRPRIIEAFDKKIDEAVIWGQGRPVTWPTGIMPTAINVGNTVATGTGADLGIDISNLMGTIEAYGFDPTGFLADVSMKSRLRNLRGLDGTPLFAQGVQKTPDTIYGLPTSYIKNGSFQNTVSRLITGKMDEAKFAIRSDLSFQIFTEGVISDENGKVIMNLMQNDMKALRVVMRLGWAVPNPIHQLNPDRAGYPFAVLTT
jgi:HK97 family phage major capsid protein